MDGVKFTSNTPAVGGDGIADSVNCNSGRVVLGQNKVGKRARVVKFALARHRRCAGGKGAEENGEQQGPCEADKNFV